MMGAPRKQQTAHEAPRPKQSRPERRQRRDTDARRRAAGHRRFVALVIVPVVLMIGSVYLHTVAANLGEKTVQLEQQSARAKAEAEDLRLQVTDLSRPGRIRPMAREELKMLDPSGADLKMYDNTGEDGRPNGGEQAKEDAG